MNLIFDFDGTLCNSFEITIKILNNYLQKQNKKIVTASDFRTKGIEALIKDYKLNKLQLILYVYQGRRELSKHINEMKIYPNLAQVLMKLHETNNLIIASTNSKANIQKFLNNNHLENIFQFISSSPFILQKSKKLQSIIKDNKLSIKDTLYIGDEVRDIKAAHQAGIKSASVTWGFEGKVLLTSNHPNYIVNKPTDLLKINL